MRNIKDLKYGKIQRLRPDSPVFCFNRLVATHKLDGTNGRIIWDGEEITTGSRNRIVTPEDDNYGFSAWVKENVDPAVFEEVFEDTNAVVFGEFISNKIQGRVAYGDEYKFIVFDVFIHSVFLDWKDVVDVANKLNFPITDYYFLSREHIDYERLQKAVEGREDPFAVECSDDSKKMAEGVVVRPPMEFKYKSEGRLLYKVKSEKFAEVKRGANKSESGGSKKFAEEEVEKVDKYITESRIHSVIGHMKEADNDIKVSRRITGDVIKNVIKDIIEEADEELDDKVLGKYGGGKVAQLFHRMIDQGLFV